MNKGDDGLDNDDGMLSFGSAIWGGEGRAGGFAGGESSAANVVEEEVKVPILFKSSTSKGASSSAKAVNREGEENGGDTKGYFTSHRLVNLSSKRQPGLG